jgi:hypothetical protein
MYHVSVSLSSSENITVVYVTVEMQVFEFADKYRGAYSSSLHSAVCPFYCDVNGYQVGNLRRWIGIEIVIVIIILDSLK